ncbi:Oxygen-evolving enhancer protein 3, partial [Dillenia turbinata]
MRRLGTRSFLKKGIHMAIIGTNGSACQLKKYAFDLLALEDFIGSNAWNYIGKYLRLKYTSCTMILTNLKMLRRQKTFLRPNCVIKMLRHFCR